MYFQRVGHLLGMVKMVICCILPRVLTAAVSDELSRLGNKQIANSFKIIPRRYCAINLIDPGSAEHSGRG